MKRIGDLNEQLNKRPYLHRIELLERFYKMLDDKELVFVRPSCWSDPLENMIFNAKILKGGKPFEHPAKKSIYSQCWSFEGDSYALWQIYTTKSNDSGKVMRHKGIRITTHLEKLGQISKFNEGTFHYGLVDYMWKKDLVKLPNDAEFIKGLKIMKVSVAHLKTLLVKRKSYSYENEVRLLAVPGKSLIDRKNENLCRVKIEPLKFISSLRLDPILTYQEFKREKEKLIDKYGFKETQIKHSTLNKSNKFIFDLGK